MLLAPAAAELLALRRLVAEKYVGPAAMLERAAERALVESVASFAAVARLPVASERIEAWAVVVWTVVAVVELHWLQPEAWFVAVSRLEVEPAAREWAAAGVAYCFAVRQLGSVASVECLRERYLSPVGLIPHLEAAARSAIVAVRVGLTQPA